VFLAPYAEGHFAFAARGTAQLRGGVNRRVIGGTHQIKAQIDETSSVLDVAMAMAMAWPEGLDSVGEVLAASRRSLGDSYLWAAMAFLSSKLPEADPDAVAWTGLVRSKRGIGVVAREVATARKRADHQADAKLRQGSLFDVRETGADR